MGSSNCPPINFFKTMKKFNLFVMLAIVVTIFSACQKDELTGEQPQAVASVQEKPDVYVENGYLAFKDMNAVDSVINVLSSMTKEEKDTWDAQMGFKSARADFENLFDKYEKLTSKEEFFAFKKKYQDRLTFNDADPEDASIDYPYSTRYFLPVLNQEGIYKVGYSLVKYTKDDQIVILDGDMNKLKNLSRYSGDKMVVYLPRLKDSEVSYIYDDFADDNPDQNQNPNTWYTVGKRRLRNELRRENGLYFDGIYHSGWKVIFYQKGEAKNFFGHWKSYKTNYKLRNVSIQIASGPVVNLYTGVGIETGDVYDATHVLAWNYVNGSTSLFYYRPDVSFYGETYSRGVGIFYPVDYN